VSHRLARRIFFLRAFAASREIMVREKGEYPKKGEYPRAGKKGPG